MQDFREGGFETWTRVQEASFSRNFLKYSSGRQKLDFWHSEAKTTCYDVSFF